MQKENKCDGVINLCFQGHLGTLKFTSLGSYNKDVDVRLKVAYFANMGHIFKMYERGGVDLNCFSKYFQINSTPLSLRLGAVAKGFKTMFAHLDSSRGEFQPSVISNHLNDRNWLVISPNKNMYPKNHRFYAIAEMFVGFLVGDYIDAISASAAFCVVDSCFWNIVCGLWCARKLNPERLIVFSPNGRICMALQI